jgi:hypothetical protein
VQGTKWTFEETDATSGEVTEKTWFLEEQEGGSRYRFMHTGMKPRIVWVETDDDGRVFWNRKVSLDRDTGEPIRDCYFEPPRLRFDPTLPQGSPFGCEAQVNGTTVCDSTLREIVTEDCEDWHLEAEDNLIACEDFVTDTMVTDIWSLLGEGNPKEVPAGEFTDTLWHKRLEYEGGAADASAKEYYWAKGIGKIWELDRSNKTEELTSVCFP